MATAFLGLLTAIATALGVTVGLFAKKTSAANQQADTSQQQVQALESQNASLKQRVTELEAGANGSPTPSASTPGPANVVDGPAVRHEGDLNLVPDSGYDLTSTDPRWGQDADCKHQVVFENGTPPQISTDGLCSGHFIYVDSLQLKSSDAGDYSQCRTSTGYERAPALTTKPGVRYCIHTTDDFYTLLTVKSVSARRITIYVKTWEKE